MGRGLLLFSLKSSACLSGVLPVSSDSHGLAPNTSSYITAAAEKMSDLTEPPPSRRSGAT